MKVVFVIFVFLFLKSLVLGLPQIKEDVVAKLKTFYNNTDGYQNLFEEGDIFCYCNDRGCDDEVSQLTNKTITGICRVYGACRRTEVYDNETNFASLELSCLTHDALQPTSRPFACQTSPKVKNQCCYSDLCLPYEAGYVTFGNEESEKNSYISIWIYAFLTAGIVFFIFTLIAILIYVYCFSTKNSFLQKVEYPLSTIQNEILGKFENLNESSRLPTISQTENDVPQSSKNIVETVLHQRKTIHQIQIGELIGSGKFGRVYKCNYRNEKVAVKKFFAHECISWKRETEIYQSPLLRHPNILRWIASDEQIINFNAEFWLVTEYLEFGTLFEYLSKNAIDAVIGIQLIRSIVQGILYLHTEIHSAFSYKPKIVHRDIKPTNILIRNNLTCVIADFGLAICCYHGDLNHNVENSLKGTPRYCAPEKLMNAPMAKKFPCLMEQDIYSMSLVIWEICQRIGLTPNDEGQLPNYERCFGNDVSENPSAEEMTELVAKNKQRPHFSDEWLENNKNLRSLFEIIEESWHEHGSFRPTALVIRNVLDRIIETNEFKIFLT